MNQIFNIENAWKSPFPSIKKKNGWPWSSRYHLVLLAMFFGVFYLHRLLELRFWAGYLDSPEAEAHGGHGSSRSTVDGSEIQNNHSLDGAKTLVNKWDNLPTSTG